MLMMKDFNNCWLFFINHKYIGTLYLLFGFASGIIGLILSVFIRLELGYVGNMFFAGNFQLYNAVIAAYAFIMIFFFWFVFRINIKIFIVTLGIYIL